MMKWDQLGTCSIRLDYIGLKDKEIFKVMRLIGGVQGYSSKIFNPYVIIARRNSQHLKKLISFVFLDLVHNLSISLILKLSYKISIKVLI